MKHDLSFVCSLAALTLIGSAASTARGEGLCRGDCNGNGLVTIDELVRSVNVALEAAPYRLCPPADTDGNGQIEINELMGAVNTALGGCPATVSAYRAPELSAPAGPGENGEGVLPNGRILRPAGTQVTLETFPLNLALTPDGRYLLVTNDGWGNEEGERGLQIVDTATNEVRRTDVEHFFGLAVAPSGDRVFVSDGDTNRIEALRIEDGGLVREADPLAVLPNGTYPTGLAASPDGSYLYAVGLLDNSLWSIDLATGAAQKSDDQIGNFPYTILLSADGSRAYVSSWGINNGNNAGALIAPLPVSDPNAETRSSVAEVDLSDPAAPHLVRYAPIARSVGVDDREVFGGSHPSAMRLSPDGSLLYVTASNVDLLVVLDTASMETIAEVPLDVFEDAPLPQRLQGLYPNALAVSADGSRVYVADAGINAVQVVDADPAARRFTPAGFIPVGWFPSALALSAAGTLYVANAKGDGIGANAAELIDINDISFNDTPYYIGRLMKGSLSVVGDVAAYDATGGRAQVEAANGLAPVDLRWVDGDPGPGEVRRGNPVPIDFGSGPSDAIRHVVFILKENRTYDQVFGDLAAGNGDPELTLFGEDVTPNHHALARQFALGDNFYADGEVSIPGHEWTDQGNSTDFTEKLWPRNYHGTIGDAIVEYGQEGFAKSGYLFPALQAAGISYRVYGEAFAYLSTFEAGVDGAGVPSSLALAVDIFGSPVSFVVALPSLLNGDVAALEKRGVDVDRVRTELFPHIMIDYPSNILSNVTDVHRAELFEGELASFERSGRMPSFLFLWLCNDHTFGAKPHMPTPDSAVADNDAGLGMIVDALSHSSFWPHTAIFVTEDDAQDGQDHVSANRTIGMVISPWARHGYVSPVHHSNLSMLKTIGLLLGMPPRSQFDRYATDMRDYFTTEPDLAPYSARPASVAALTNPEPAQAANSYLRRAAAISESLNLATYDEAGEDLSRVLWLVHVGERFEAERRWAVVGAVLLLFAALIAGGFAVGRRRSSAPA
jgi:DNA-binding beta-propeller fold protein YncE